MRDALRRGALCFLTKLPKGWRYGVEIRNADFLKPEYFQTLSTHGVAHVFSSWDSMPPIGAQWAMPESLTSTEFFGARFLLKPGRKYEEAVNLFSPYERAQEINAEGRAAGARMIRETTAQDARAKGFIYVNNRFEGNALETIAAMLDAVAKK